MRREAGRLEPHVIRSTILVNNIVFVHEKADFVTPWCADRGRATRLHNQGDPTYKHASYPNCRSPHREVLSRTRCPSSAATELRPRG